MSGRSGLDDPAYPVTPFSRGLHLPRLDKGVKLKLVTVM